MKNAGLPLLAAYPHPKFAMQISASPQGGGEEKTPLYLPLAGRSKPRSGFGWGECAAAFERVSQWPN